MSGGSFLRRSFRKIKKQKEKKADFESTQQNASNFALALGEARGLSSENRRLRQELEFERARNRQQSNDYCFPFRRTLVSTEQQTDSSERIDFRDRCNVLEEENKYLHREIRDLETRIQTYTTLETVQSEVISVTEQLNRFFNHEGQNQTAGINLLQQQLSVLQEQVQNLTSDSSSLNRRSLRDFQGTRTEGKKTAIVDYHTELDEIKELMVRCTEDTQQRFDHLEDILAREMTDRLKKDKFQIPDTPELLKMPSDIKPFAWKLQFYMVTMDKVKHFSRALGVEPCEVERMSSRESSTPRGVFWSALCSWCSQNWDGATLVNLQEACDKSGITVLQKGLMPEKDRRTLERCYSYLETNLLPIVTLPYLRDHSVLDDSDVFYVTSQSTRRERCASLLDLLPLFGKDALDTFCQALVKSEQSHLADRLIENLDLFSSRGVEGEAYIRKHSVSRESLLPISSQNNARSDRMSQQDYILLKILSTLLTKSSHMEAMIMNMSSGSNYSSLAGSRCDQIL